MELSEPLPFPADAGFELIEEIGRGGSGIVYAVRWQEKNVALKLPQADLGERDRTHFLREAALLQKAAHPGVVEVLDAGTLSDGRPYLVMPLLSGASLAEHVSRRGRLPIDEALDLFLPLAEAVAHLHAMGLAHRDIKPENVFYLEKEERLLLLDFGIARETDKPPSTTTQANIVRGTPATMAPERFFGARATASSDAYELVLVLYTMLTGALPWGESTDASERLSPKAPSELGVSVPVSIEQTILEALSTRPERRPTVRVLMERLSGKGTATAKDRRTQTLATKPPPRVPAPAPEGDPDLDLPNEEEALAMLSSPSAKRVTEASSIAPLDRTTGKTAQKSEPRASWLRPGAAVVAALGVGALAARAWPTSSPANAAHPSLTEASTTAPPVLADPTATTSSAPVPTASDAALPSASAVRGDRAAPSSSAGPAGSARAAPGPVLAGSACHQLRLFNCAHNGWASEIGCKQLRDGTLDESYTAQDEVNCRFRLDDLHQKQAAPLPSDAEGGLEYCARLRDAYCSPELKGIWAAKTLCAQGQGLYDRDKTLTGKARVDANNTCAQMLPGLTASLKKAYEGTSPPPGWPNP